MGLLIEELDEDAAGIRLSEADLRAAGESRLRAARLYSEDTFMADSVLYANVTVSGSAFGISLRLMKSVVDAFGHSGLAMTWDWSSVGTHGRNAQFIVSGLSQHIDRFLTAYLRINESACTGP